MSLEKIFNAQSVAIVGASKNPTKRGYQAIKTLQEEKYEGKIYPVNPKESHILGLKCYPKVSEIPDPVDLALITTPAATIPSVLEDCGKKGVEGAVIIAGGFRELGAKGLSLEQEMLEKARQYGIRIIGPNTSGMMNLKSNLNLVGIHDSPKGEIALVSQSGNMALSIITEAMVKSNKGFSYYVGVGNETDIKFHEYLDFFGKDPDTKAILMYVEGMSRGREFLQQAYKTTLEKPIILLKSGRSVTGKRSAGSHTGSLAGMSEVAHTAFKRAGIIVVEDPAELFPIAETLSSLPSMRHNSVAILADGGGHATIAADILSELGVEIPTLHSKTQTKLKAILPFTASIANPVDVAGGADADPSIFAECARIILKDHNIGGLLIVGLFGGYGIRFAESLSLMEEDAAHQMGRLVKKRKKPIVVHSLYASRNTHPIELLRYYNIPVYDSLDVACKCIGALAERGSYLKEYHAKVNFVINWGEKAKRKGRKIITQALEEGRRFLLEHEAKALLGCHGAPVSEDRMVSSAKEAVEVAKEMGGKVALKVVSPDIMHKSDAGGVKLNLQSEKEIRAAYQDIMENARQYKPDADIRGVLVSSMAEPGLEVIIGTKIDDQFGPIIMFGIGGIMVEVLKDVSFRVLPISSISAKKMMTEIRSAPILDGFRGTAPRDKKALRKLLVTCSDIMEAYPEIQEMDLNPILVYEKGAVVVDARIILREDLSSLPKNNATNKKASRKKK